MKVRYLLGLVHKEIEQLEEVESRRPEMNTPQQQRNNRILHMSRALKRKYNMDSNCSSSKEQFWCGATKHESLHASRYG